MNRRSLATFFAAACLATVSTPAQALDLDYVKTVYYTPYLTEAVKTVFSPVFTWKCLRSDKTVCSDADWTDPSKRQVVVLSAGFQDADRNFFWQKFTQFN